MKTVTKHVEEQIQVLKDYCTTHILEERSSKGKALLETTADILEGLQKAFQDFAEGQSVWASNSKGTISPKSAEPWD